MGKKKAGGGDTRFRKRLCPRSSLARAEGMAAEEARTCCQAFRRQPLGQAEGRLCVAWPVRCAAQSCVNCGSILCFLWEVRNSCSWWRAVPPCACSVDRTGRRRRSATASAACRCSTVLPGEQPAGSVCGVGEAAVALYCMPRRVACGARVAARGTGGARGAAVGQPRGACAPRKTSTGDFIANAVAVTPTLLCRSKAPVLCFLAAEI